jgi:hypothetical protein
MYYAHGSVSSLQPEHIHRDAHKKMPLHLLVLQKSPSEKRRPQSARTHREVGWRDEDCRRRAPQTARDVAKKPFGGGGGVHEILSPKTPGTGGLSSPIRPMSAFTPRSLTPRTPRHHKAIFDANSALASNRRERMAWKEGGSIDVAMMEIANEEYYRAKDYPDAGPCLSASPLLLHHSVCL